MGKIKDITGMKFGKLTVVGYVGVKNHEAYWECKCDCGEIVTVRGTSLRRGNTTSCGCVFTQKNRERWYKHGDSHTRLHNLWTGMLQRCRDPKHKNYERYGGRGIKVCDEWLSYENFKEWSMRNGYDSLAPFGKCTLDRIDNNGDYEPNNCRWVSLSEQAKNKENKHIITYRGETLSLRQWSRRTGLNYHTLLYRVRQGWSPEKILTPPWHKI